MINHGGVLTNILIPQLLIAQKHYTMCKIVAKSPYGQIYIHLILILMKINNNMRN